MGCDIHSFLEVRVDGAWVNQSGTDEYGGPLRGPLEERNYELFGLLAGVRSNNFRPLFEGRGLPEDRSPEAIAYNGWEHSHSFFTLAELLEIDLSEVSTVETRMSLPDYVSWRAWGRERGEYPYSCWYWSNAEVKLTADEADANIEDAQAAFTGSSNDFWAHYRQHLVPLWKSIEVCASFRRRATQVFAGAGGCVAMMFEARNRHGVSAEDVRVVFGFDS